MRVYESYVSCVNEGRVLNHGKSLNIQVADIINNYVSEPELLNMIAKVGIRCIIAPISPMGPISENEEAIKNLMVACPTSKIQTELRSHALQNDGLTIEFESEVPIGLYDFCNGLKATMGVTNIYNPNGQLEPVAVIYPRDCNEAFVGEDKFTSLNYKLMGFNVKEDDETGELLLESIVIMSDPYINIVDRDIIKQVGAEALMRVGFVDADVNEIDLSEGHETEHGTLYTVGLTGTGEQYAKYNPINEENPLLLWMYRVYSNNWIK